ncbi:MAG TPA: hypothetical protein VGE18_02555 [Candidatus Paceibacterota bacterium]
MQPVAPEPTFLNLDYILYLLYRFFEWLLRINWLNLVYTIIVLMAIALITVILYSLVRLHEIREEENKKKKVSSVAPFPVSTATGPSALDTEPVTTRYNETWNHIRERLLSDNASDWRLAIIEADIYMDRLLDQKGFHGDTIGDKLKQISPAELSSVQIAWEAHKVRNRIAHEGAAFALTMPESRRVLSYYEIVFRDLEVID